MERVITHKCIDRKMTDCIWSEDSMTIVLVFGDVYTCMKAIGYRESANKGKIEITEMDLLDGTDFAPQDYKKLVEDGILEGRYVWEVIQKDTEGNEVKSSVFCEHTPTIQDAIRGVYEYNDFEITSIKKTLII